MPRLFDCEVVLETLQRLQHQFHEMRHHAARLVTALGVDQFSPALEIIDLLRLTVDEVVAMNARLHANVVPADGLGAPPECIAELAIRAQRMVVIEQLGRLRTLLHDPIAPAREPSALTEQLRTLDEIVTFLDEELRRIDGLWMLYRRGDRRLDELGEHRTALYRAAVRAAHRAMLHLLEQPNVAHFLHDGIKATELPAVHAACRRIRAALAIQIDIEPARLGLPLPRN